MAKKTIFVSDLSGREIPNDRDAVRITVTFGDARRGQYVIDAHPDDAEVKSLVSKGTQQARRGRKPKGSQVDQAIDKPREAQRASTWTRLGAPRAE